MKENKTLPMSSAGITRYFDDAKSKFVIKPAYIILFAGIVMLSVLLLHLVRLV